MFNKRFLALLTVMILCLALLGACGSDSPSSDNTAAEGSGDTGDGAGNTDAGDASLTATLTLYTSESEDLAAEMIADFNTLYPNITIEVFRSGSGKVVSKIEAELETGSTDANIVWIADIGYIKQLDDDGLIAHYSPEAAAGIDPAYAYNNGMAHEVRVIYNVLAYNTTLITENPPTDWSDLADPAYSGRVAMANPNYSGGAFTGLVVHVQNEELAGWDLYDAIAANDVKFEESNGNLQTKVSSGEYALVAVVDFMALNAKNEGSPVEVVWPESGAILVPTPIALIDNMDADQLAAAQAFVDYMFLQSTQELFSRQGYIPVLPGVAAPDGAPSLDSIVTMPFDLDYFVANSTEIRNTYEQKYGA